MRIYMRLAAWVALVVWVADPSFAQSDVAVRSSSLPVSQEDGGLATAGTCALNAVAAHQ